MGEGLKDEEGAVAKKSLIEVGPKVVDGVKDLPSGLSKAKMRIAAVDVMSAVFRATSTAQSDKNSNMARDMLKLFGQGNPLWQGGAQE